MKTIIIALPVPEDTDIFEVQEVINAAVTPTFNPDAEEGDDSILSVTYENADALLDDLGVEVKHRPWRACTCEDVCDEPDCWCHDDECPAREED